MGISDEDYAKAKQVQLVKKLQKAYEQQQMEKEMAISTSTSLAGLLGGLGSGVSVAQPGAYQNVAQAQQAYNSATTQATYPTGITISNTTNTPVWTTQGMQGITTLNEQDLKHEAMTAPLSALVDMWQMRWQGEWVNETEFQEDDFWRLALIRLTGANKLEKHHLASQYAAVYRIIE